MRVRCGDAHRMCCRHWICYRVGRPVLGFDLLDGVLIGLAGLFRFGPSLLGGALMLDVLLLRCLQNLRLGRLMPL